MIYSNDKWEHILETAKLLFLLIGFLIRQVNKHQLQQNHQRWYVGAREEDQCHKVPVETDPLKILQGTEENLPTKASRWHLSSNSLMCTQLKSLYQLSPRPGHECHPRQWRRWQHQPTFFVLQMAVVKDVIAACPPPADLMAMIEAHPGVCESHSCPAAWTWQLLDHYSPVHQT